MNVHEEVCLVSGAGGYLGGKVSSALAQRGWQVVALTRNPKPGQRAIPFQLGTEPSAAALKGAHSLVHCAYDFKPLKWNAIQEVNVAGTEKLLKTARAAGVKNIVYISSVSAYEGCRSLYGRAKLETEAIARWWGAIVIRPGLIWGESSGGIFGRLVRQVEHARVLPLFGGGKQIQYPIHEADLAQFICDCAEGKVPKESEPITVAHEQPWTFRQILEEIGRRKGNQPKLIPVPWHAVWLGLKCAETVGLRLGFRSDNLISLMRQNPNPSFAQERKLNIPRRPFKLVRLGL